MRQTDRLKVTCCLLSVIWCCCCCRIWPQLFAVTLSWFLSYLLFAPWLCSCSKPAFWKKPLTDSPPESSASSGDSDWSFSCISGWLIWFTLSSGMRELSVNCHQWSSSSIKGFRTAAPNMEVVTIKELYHSTKFQFRSRLLINLLGGCIRFWLN